MDGQTRGDATTTRRQLRRIRRYTIGGVALLALVAPPNATATPWLVLLFFSLASAQMIFAFLLQVVRTRERERQAYVERIALGLADSSRERAIGSLQAALVFAASWRFAELPILWGVLAALFLATGLAGLLYASVARSQPDKVSPLAELTDDFLDQRVTVSRRAQPILLAALVAWFYAWRGVYQYAG